MMTTKGQKLDFDLGVETVEADPQHMKILVTRALHNATKFGQAQSSIKVSSRLDNKNVVIEIQNLGPKISQNVLDKILSPFTLDENVMNHSVGMGLGLTICQTLLKAHQGRLEISNTDDGVSVRFIFPEIRK